VATSRKTSRPPGRASGLGLGFAIVAATVVLQFIGSFDGLERRLLDLRFIARGEKSPHPDILLVTIDEATRKALGKATGAITRDEYARALDALTTSGARLVAFDLDFATQREGDERLAKSIACAGNIILSSFIAMGDWVRPNPSFRSANVPCMVDDAVLEVSREAFVGEEGVAVITWKGRPGFVVNGFRVYYAIEPFDDPKSIPEGTGGFVDVSPKEKSLKLTVEGIPPGTALYAAVRGIRFGSLMGEGAVNIIEDPDARVRSIPLVVGRSGDDPEKKAALALETAIKVTFAGDPRVTSSTSWAMGFEQDEDSLVIPLVEGRMIINYRGGRDTYPRLSFSDALEGRFDRKTVEGKIVLVGNTHQLAHDEYPTPFGSQKVSRHDTGDEGLKTGYTPGLEIHANALDTILSEDFISPLAHFFEHFVDTVIIEGWSEGSSGLRFRLWDAALVLVVGVLAVLLLVLLRPPLSVGALIFFVLMSMVTVGAYLGFSNAGLWVPMAGPLITLAGVYAGGLLHRANLHEREKRWIKETFGKYLAPAVVEQITRDPSLVELGGVERELTAFFSDIEKFSSISEQLGSPKALVGLLNEYLSAMAEIIEKYGGTIDKYEGDAIIAFWGAPLHFPDHAHRACNACLDMQAGMKKLREKWRNEGNWPDLVSNMRVRMGLNTGRIVVGNVGSEGRLNYTIMGDAVNLASRLEGANKPYGTYTMISHDTYWQVRDHFEVRFLDVITVVGKKQPVRVYELMSRRGELTTQQVRMIKAYNEGIVHYRKREWQEAISSFDAAMHFVPDDGPSKAYIERCRMYNENPPPADWDGVFKLTDK